MNGGCVEMRVKTEDEDIFGAIMADDLETIEAMLEAEPDLAEQEQYRSPILLAAYRRRHDALQALLRRQPAVDVFEAAAIGDLRAVRAVLDAAPQLVETYSGDGLAPLHLAAFFGRLAVVSELLERGARIDAFTRDDTESTALHGAVTGEHDVVAEFLLARGATADAQQAGGFTPLHLASRRGNRRLVLLLLASGANASMRTDRGQTAGDVAYEFEHDSLAALLRARER